MKKSMQLIAMFVLSLATTAHSQTARRPDPAAEQVAREAKLQYVGAASPDSTTACSFTFTTGTGNKYMKYCVTANGNIVQFASLSGQEYIANSAGEGYAFCDYDTATQYYDYGSYGDSGNWKPPVTVSSSATNVKISRTTTDGIYTLTQTIAQNAGNVLAQVTMALKNNTTASHHIGLLRYADVDAGGFANNSFDYTYRTAWGYNEGGYGLQLEFVSASSGIAFNGAYSQIISGGPNSCQIFEHVLGPLQNTDGSIFAEYDMELKKSATGTVVVAYKAF
jgi:hypothetical protein